MNKEGCFTLYYLIFLDWMLGKKRQISGQQDKGRKMCGGREECMDEGEDESFVVLMLNELENTIELF